MTETMSPPKTTTKGGGGGVIKTAPGGRMSSGADDFNRLAQMLERIRKTLDSMVHLNPPVIPKVLSDRFIETWPQAEASLLDAIVVVMDETQRGELLLKLEAAGLTDTMLEMKEASLYFYLDRIDGQILTYSPERSWFDRFIDFVKPGCKVMNSLFGSLLKAIPGIDLVKEFKDHVEAAHEVAAAVAGTNQE
jgi:hypothetical protein